MKFILQTLPGIGDLRVVRTLDCDGYRWTVTWIDGGDKPSLTVCSILVFL
jgi:hypothetical protein